MGALKLDWRVKKQGISIGVRTIGKILKIEGLTRKYRVKKIKYRYVKALLQPGELVERCQICSFIGISIPIKTEGGRGKCECFPVPEDKE